MMSKRGKDLILINGYTFFQRTQRIWACSKYPKCKAKICRNVDGSVTILLDQHLHSALKIVKTLDGTLVRV